MGLVKRIKVDEFNRVSEIEFYEEAYPEDVLRFLRDYKIGRNFAHFGEVPLYQPLYQTDDAHVEALSKGDLTAET